MKRTILNITISVIIGLSFICCEKNKDDLFLTKAIKIEIDSNGGEYTFDSNSIEVILPPDEFNAKIVNNTIVGKYAGHTSATIKSNNNTYECDITVSASYTYYVDMAIYIGWTRSQIEKLYGKHSEIKKNVYYYEPLFSDLIEKKVAFIYDEKNKVTACASLFTIYQMGNVIKHLQQRYLIYLLKDGIGIYGNALKQNDATIIVICDIKGGTVLYSDKESLDNENI